MYFKLTSLLILILSLFTLGCTDYLKGKKKSDEVIEVTQLEPQCMKDFPTFLNQYFSDTSTDEQIEKNMTCFQNSMKAFMRYTRGENPSQYKASEIQHFLNRYLLGENKINDELLVEFMRIKTLIVGGSEKFYTREELEQFLFFTNTIKAELKNMRGYMGFLLFQESPKVNEHLNNIEVIRTQLVTSFMNLISQTKILNSFYELSHLKSFAEKMDTFINTKGTLKSILKHFDLIIAFKNLFLGEHTKLQSLSEWKAYTKWAVDSYILSLQYFHEIIKFRFAENKNWSKMILFTDQILSLIETSPNLRAKGFLDSKDIDQLIDELWSINIFKSQLSRELVKSTYRRALTHLIEGKISSAIENYEYKNLTLSHLSVIKNEYLVWKNTQNFINQTFTNKTEIGLSELKQMLLRHPRAQFLQSPLKVSDWNEWQKIFFKTPRPVALTDNLKLNLSADLEKLTYNQSTLSQMNLIRTWVRLTMRGYGTAPVDGYFSSTLSEESLIRLEKNFRDFGLAVGFLDPRTFDAPKRAFKEANYFTFSGNGDDKMDAFETFELLNIFLTGGGVTLQQVEKIVFERNCQVSEEDAMGKFKAETNCFKNILLEKSATLFDNMIDFEKFLNSLNPNQYDQFFNFLLTLGKTDGEKPNVIDYSEMRAITTLIQYVESLMATYDANLSGTLSKDEVLKAFPRFENLILNMLPYEFIKTETMARQAFLYLVFENKVPTGTQLLASFLSNKWQKKQVSRLNLFKVVAVLKQYAN
jgi:hypothetical protein